MRVASGAFVARRNGMAFVTGNSGFPKYLNTSKAIDAHFGKGGERPVVGENPNRQGRDPARMHPGGNGALVEGYGTAETEAATPEAAEFDGWATALKPGGAAEPVPEGEAASAPAVDLDKLKTLVAKAAGVDGKRGDQMEFASIPFAAPLGLPEASAFEVGSLAPFFQGLVAVVIALMMVFLVVRPLLGQLRAVAPDLVEAAALPGTVEDVAARLEDAEREAKARRLLEQRESLVVYASSDPERTAEILRGWLTEGG